MTPDEKISEVLEVVRETREMSLETRQMVLELRDMTLETRTMMIEERALNNSRFGQLATGLSDVRKEVNGVKAEMARMNVNLNAKFDKVYESLSQDIQVFGDDLHQVKRRVTHLEKKLLS